MQHGMDNIARRLCVLMLEENDIGCCDANKATNQKLWDGDVIGYLILKSGGLGRQDHMEACTRDS
jgi:hypothetical protein